MGRGLRRDPGDPLRSRHLPANDTERQAAKDGPTATNTWLVARIVQDAATVIARVFDEADRRDSNHTPTRVALVDGNVHQIDRIKAEAKARNVNVAVICDLVHVVEHHPHRHHRRGQRKRGQSARSRS